jgi:hypothetical protein
MPIVNWSAGALFFVTACVGTPQRTNALYSDSDGVGGVVKLVGDIGTVDGKAVADLGHTFELPIGCHTVTNVTEWGGHDASAARMAKLPAIPFAVEMRAEHTYVLRIAMAGDSELVVEAIEQDGSGNVTRRFEQGTSCAG